MNAKNATEQNNETESIRVVLVDDAQIILDRLESSLSTIDSVRIVGTSKQSDDAINQIERLTPNLVILDVRLEDSDGIDVLRAVTENHPTTRVFVFSNDSSPTSRERFLTAGAERFFDKSLDFKALRDAVRELSMQSKSS